MMQKRTNPVPGRMGARQIYEALRDQIMSLVYGTDGLLPSSRALADEMGVARSTVTIAYEQLAAEGFIETRHGARPRVARAVVERGRTRATSRPSTRKVRLSAFGERLRQDPPSWTAPPRGLVANFRYGELSPSDFPVLAWKKAVTAAMARKPERLAYDDPCGSLRLRTALQGYLWRSRSVRCEVDQIVVVNGSQQGLDICARLLLDSVDRFVMEDPGYLMARHTFAATGAGRCPLRSMPRAFRPSGSTASRPASPMSRRRINIRSAASCRSDAGTNCSHGPDKTTPT